jgi:DNA-binding NarL/FixJ family response regulator
VRSISYSPALQMPPDRARPALELVEFDPIRVVIVDAQPVFRAGFAAMLEGERDMEVAGMASGAEEAVALVASVQPDVALVALDLLGLGGLEAVRRIAQDPLCADVDVIVLAAEDGDEELFAALRDGASGFLLKSTASEELVRAVRVVAGGEAFLPPSATRRLIGEFRSRPHAHMPSSDQLDDLTAREREVIALVAAGLRNDEIAEHLVISLATVKTHVSRALRKLDAHDRSQLVAIAYQRGIVGMSAAPRLRAVPARRLAAAGGGGAVRTLA